jgi:hypothetical protein
MLNISHIPVSKRLFLAPCRPSRVFLYTPYPFPIRYLTILGNLFALSRQGIPQFKVRTLGGQGVEIFEK